MNKPTPKTEIVTERIGGVLIRVWTYSDDAYKWVERNCGDFGRLYKPAVKGGHFEIFVSPGYDFAEVWAYIESCPESKTPADS